MRTRYIATVEVEADTLGLVDLAQDALASFDPVVRPLGPGLWQVRMSVHAEGLAAACQRATAVAQAATGAPAVAAYVVSEHRHDEAALREDLAPVPVSVATRRSASGATRGRGDLGGVLAGTYELRAPEAG